MLPLDETPAGSVTATSSRPDASVRVGAVSIPRPQPGDHSEYLGTYVVQVPDGAILETLAAQIEETTSLLTAAGANIEMGSARNAGELLDACAPEHRGWEWRFLKNRVDASLVSTK